MTPNSTLRATAASLAAACVLLMPVGNAHAQTTTRPTAGIAERTPRSVALTNARLVIRPGEIVERGTLVVRDGRITAAGPRSQVPADALAIDLGGRTIYAGFIDANSDYAQPREAPAPAAPTRRTPEVEDVAEGARHWNRRVRPENDLAQSLKPDPKSAAALRRLGFTSVLSVPGKGILRGQSALVSTTDSTRLNEVLLQARVTQHIAFEHGEWPSNEYPTSLMGAIALVRQTLLDARWQQQRGEWQIRHRDAARIEADLSLDALAPLLERTQPAVLVTRDELDADRAIAVAREFGLKSVLLGNGYEYRRVAAIRAAGVPMVLPLEFAEAPAIEDPDRALDVSLAELEHWEWSPFNARVLAEAGVPFAFTASGLKKPEETFWANLRKAVQKGLDEDAALAALTVQPATLLGVADRLGTLEPGRLAHFVVADADLFRSEGARIHETWIDGRRFSDAPAAGIDPRGTWTLQWTGAQGPATLVLGGELKALKATVGDETFPVTLGATELLFYMPGKLIGHAVERVVLVAAIQRDRFSGRWVSSDGREIGVAGNRDVRADSARAQDPPRRTPLPAGTKRYPAGEFGVAASTEGPRAVVVRNATIWTQSTRGTLADADMLVVNGRISAVGSALRVPAGTVEIDARGRHVSPGIIDAHSHMAMARGVNESSHSVTSEVRVGDVLDPTDISIYRQLAGGVTSAHLLHGSANTIGGQAQMIKLRWGSDAQGLRFEGAPPTIKFALGENVKQANWGEAFTSRYPQTRMGVQELLVDSFLGAREHAARRAARGGEPVRRDLRLEALAEVLAGERFVHIHSYRQDEILGFVRIARRFGIVPTFQHVLEGYKVADELAALGAGASTFSDWWAFKMEVADAIPYGGALMARQGVVVSFNSDSSELARRLNAEAAKAVKYGGLDERAALDLVTLNPARQLRIDSRVGSLDSGKDADFVIWDAHPLSTRARVEQTWIDGRKRFDRAEDALERARIARERERLIATILPERVKALATRRGKGDADDAPAKAGPDPAHDHHLADFATLRPLYHDGEALDVCTEDHR